ncbi:response regulator transcription factor [Clostridium sp. 'deep sea']|uniref:LytR/AlgR family response regulator transcription factor n=1 Tax=Clostridium sp. 'deep sea' TaxID=2779445 RepID=UPI00189669A7|nr:LytTR family DNA-binding domain-containing protein [Clostridium sp. 'deep sea']QOR35278.1 response regulator transcription factor [Clostridium sp. 'deep sea']
MVSFLIVEDDKQQRNNLARIIKSIVDDCKIYAADNKDDALEIAKKVSINLMFVDIKLKDSNGLDFAKEVRKISQYKLTWIIFLTTHVDFMLQAFKEIHCYDYILKPYSKKKVAETIKLLLEHNSSSVDDKIKEYVVFELKGVTFKVCLEDIYFIEVQLRTCTVHTKSEVYVFSRMPLKRILEMIEVNYIVKTHKSFAVNTNHIKKIEKVSRGCWEIDFWGYDKKALLATTYKDDLMLKIN